MVAWLSTLKLSISGGGERDAACWSAQLAAYSSASNTDMCHGREQVGPSDGARRVGLGRGVRDGCVDSEVGPGSRVGRVEVDKGGSYFPPGF